MTGTAEHSRPGEIGWRLAGLVAGYRAIVDPALGDIPGGPLGFRVLVTADDLVRPTQSAIAAAAGIDRTSITSLLDRLAEAGLLSRTPHERDRRANIVTLTPRGDAALASARRAVADAESRYLASVDAPTRAAIAALVGGDPNPSSGGD